MNKKNIIAISIFLGIIGILGAISAVPRENAVDGQAADPGTISEPQKNTGGMSVALEPAQKVEIFLFHRSQRCATCVAIGKLSGQAVEERFGREVMDGKVIFREVNIDEPQNKELAEKFKASGSALFINAIRDGSEDIREDANVWRLTGDQEGFKNYLAEKISGLLGKP